RPGRSWAPWVGPCGPTARLSGVTRPVATSVTTGGRGVGLPPCATAGLATRTRAAAAAATLAGRAVRSLLMGAPGPAGPGRGRGGGVVLRAARARVVPGTWVSGRRAGRRGASSRRAVRSAGPTGSALCVGGEHRPDESAPDRGGGKETVAPGDVGRPPLGGGRRPAVLSRARRGRPRRAGGRCSGTGRRRSAATAGPPGRARTPRRRARAGRATAARSRRA